MRTRTRPRLVRLLIAAVLLFLSASTEAGAAPVPSWLVNTIETWQWSSPSPDPSGLAYDAASNRLLVADGEVDELSIYGGANYYETTLGGNLHRTTNALVAFSHEPVGLALGPPGRLFISDDNQQRVFEITLGADGVFGLGDPVTSFATPPLGNNDPEGLSYDPIGNRLFIAGGEFSQVFEVLPVDGVFGNGNDQVRQFDTMPLGVTDPEVVEFNPDSGTLYLATANGNKIVKVTTSGALVSQIDTSYVPLSEPAGMAYAPRSTDPTRKSIYISDRKVDNDRHPDENDGAIYEIAVGPLPVTLKLSDRTPRTGGRVRFFGTVSPALDGEPLLIQRRTRRGSFQTVARTTLRDAGDRRSKFSRRLRVFRDSVFRARVAASEHHLAGTSARKRVDAR
jgi:SdiA-regulated